MQGNCAKDRIYKLPTALLLQDHADDIKSQLTNPSSPSDWFNLLWDECASLRERYGVPGPRYAELSSYQALSKEVDVVFIALHGRPGEDGEMQEELTKVGLPYNGSSPRSSAVMIDKHETAQRLSRAGFLTPRQLLVERSAIDSSSFRPGADEPWDSYEATLGYPMVAKPVDDGCSTGVVKVQGREGLQQYAAHIFEEGRSRLLLEEYIDLGDADRLLEISVGLLTRDDEEGRSYEVFYLPRRAREETY